MTMLAEGCQTSLSLIKLVDYDNHNNYNNMLKKRRLDVELEKKNVSNKATRGGVLVH